MREIWDKPKSKRMFLVLNWAYKKLKLSSEYWNMNVFVKRLIEATVKRLKY